LGLSFNNTTGTISGTPAAASPATNYLVTAYNGFGGNSTTVNIKTVWNTNLAGLAISSGTLTPAFTAGTTGYTASVANATTSVTVTPSSVDPNATITVAVNGGTAAVVASGTASASLPLNVGANIIRTVVIAQDGLATKTYTITVGRGSSNASLSTIALTPYSSLTNTGTVGSTTTYTTSVSNATASVKVTATTSDPTATIKVNGVTVTSGTASGNIALVVGPNVINTAVTAQDGVTTRTYSITVTRISNNASLSTIALTPSSSLVNTGTVGSTTTYTTTASSATTSVKVTPTTADAHATVKVNGVTVASGTASGSIALPVGQTTINTVVTAQDGTTTRTYSITVTRFSNNASLSTIKLTPTSTLTNAGTVGSTTTYTTSVSNATASVKVTPTTADANATVKVNGTTVTSGTASGSIALAEGAVTTITTIVTAQDGTTTRTYLIKVTRASSSNAALTTIALTPYSTLTNTGTVGSTTTFTTSVSNATASVKITPTTADAHATVKVNGVAVTSGTASGSIALAVGSNVINTVVTAQDGTTTRTYSITVTRVSNNASLSTITLTPYSTLTNTGTVGTTTTYTTSVSNATTSVKVTPTAQDANATIKVNGTTVASGTASGSIALVVGNNTINTVVTAQDGTTTHTYSTTVTRATGPLMSLYQPVSVVKPADNVTIENDGVMVHQGISPNGDGLNDFLLIDGLIAHPENKITILDRSGAVIFEAKGYDNATNVFNGHSSLNGKMQQPGTYFYSLDYVADGQNKHKTGYIILKY
jgi:gliding motility-associated-like protein